jgi:protein O-GlcNAc transferase
LLRAGLGGGRAEQAAAMFRSRGVAGEQIKIVGWMNFQQYLECFNQVDIALDTFPWNGHTTTCHSLWMGVPVVSLAGRTALSRAGMSVMGNLGLSEDWVASNRADYLKIAQSWARRGEELAKLRGELRERMRKSVLLDAAGFTRELEQVLRKMWESWCRSLNAE